MTNLKLTSNEEIATRLFFVLPYNATEHYSAQKGFAEPLDLLKDFVLNNQEWSDAFMTESYCLNDVIHDFVGLVSEEEFFLPRISK